MIGCSRHSCCGSRGAKSVPRTVERRLFIFYIFEPRASSRSSVWFSCSHPLFFIIIHKIMHHLYHIGASKRRRSAGETRTQQPRPISPSYFLSTRCHIGIAAAAARREQGKKKKVPEREREHTHNSPPRCLFQLQLSESVLRKIITQQQQPREPPSHYGQRGFNCACRDAFANHVSHRLSKFHIFAISRQTFIFSHGFASN